MKKSSGDLNTVLDDMLNGIRAYGFFCLNFTIPDLPAALAQYAEQIGKQVDALTEPEQQQAVMNWVLSGSETNAPPNRTPDQQKEHERRAALLALDIPAMRAWASRYAVGLLGDDHVVLISMHEARAVDPTMPCGVRREGIAWLRANYPESAVLGAYSGVAHGG